MTHVRWTGGSTFHFLDFWILYFHRILTEIQTVILNVLPVMSHFSMVNSRWVIWKINRNKNILQKYFSQFERVPTINRDKIVSNMTGFCFDKGGRRCIRPILEKYQSGKVIIKYKQSQSCKKFWLKIIFWTKEKFAVPLKRRKWRLHHKNKRRMLSNIKLSTWTNWILLPSKTRNG